MADSESCRVDSQTSASAGPVDPHIIGRDCEWRTRDDHPGHYYLYRSGVQVGGWDACGKRWMDYDAASGKWSDGYPPWYVGNLVEGDSQKGGQIFFGVDRKQVPQQETLSVNGRRVAFHSVKEAFGDDSLSDDSGKLRLTMCGTKEVTDKVLSDLKSHPAMASMSSKFLVQAYRPGTWPMEVFKRPAGEGFFLSISGPPNRNGKGIEYHSQVAYEGADKLAASMSEALRRADPNYDPNKTPDLSKPRPAPGPVPGSSGDMLWLVVAILVAFLFGGKRYASSK